MTGFHQVTIGDVLTLQRGFDITKSEQTDGEIPIVSSSGISSYHNKWKVKGPSVVIGRKGTLGTVHFIQSNYWPHDTTLWIKDFKGNDPRFLNYFIKTLKLENFDVGSSNPTLNRNHVHKIKIIFPKNVEIQKRIAAVLSAYDDLIANNQRRIALLEKMAEEIFREWFVRLRFHGHEKIEVVKRVPKGWKEAKLGDLIPNNGLLTGKRPKGGAEDAGIPSIGAENVISLAQHNFSKEKYVSEHFYDAMRQGKINDKAVLFYKDGAEIGRVTLVQDGFPHEKCCVNEHVFIIRTHGLAAQYFLYFYLNQSTI
jgi:type I restriction enzyme S subunit